MKSAGQTKIAQNVSYRPLTPRNWSDLEQLFGPRGASAGCWCMWWRMRRSEWDKQKGEKNRRSFEKLVASGAPTGVLAYMGEQPVGWCAIAPRSEYSVLERSRILRPVDDKPVWSVTCFFIDRPHRKSGLTVGLLRAAVEYAAKKGAQIVEGYPIDPRGGSMPEAFAWTGLVSAFRKAGFKEVTRRSAGRPIMRYDL
jgi:GNAT superfamily N-acetyltransferase